MPTKAKKAALFVFNGDPMCFIHVLLNGLDLAGNGYDVKLVIEGSATKLIPGLDEAGNPQHHLWQNVKEKGLVEGVCKACATKTGVLDACRQQGLSLLGDMSGHPAMSAYLNQDYELITF
ncbi:MAG: DsrE family protein [Desulfobacterales bacterium]|nr:DsrE family protein [Desulfobacterales bacterium]